MIADATLERVFARRTVALLGDLIRASLWGAVFVLWVVFAQIYARMFRLTIADPVHSDFTIFYYTARLLADGLPMYGAPPARYGVDWAAQHLGNLNPPHFQLLLEPLGWLSYRHAYVLWVTVNAAALLASVLVIGRTLGMGLTWRRVAIGGALVMSAAPFTTVAVTSELSFLLMLPATLAWAAARRQRWRRAGVWLGVCISLKLFFLLFVPWLVLRKRWDTVIAALATTAGITCVGIVVYGPRAYLAWLHLLGSVGWWWLPMNASWHGFVSRVFAGAQTIAAAVSWPAAVTPLAAAGGIVVCAVTVWSARRLGGDAAGSDVAFLLLLLGGLIASPLGWVYYLPFALGPLLGVLWTGTWRLLPTRQVVIVALLCAGLYVSLEQAAAGQPSAFLTVTLASAYFWSTLALWLAVLGLSRRFGPWS
jgi:hypothetical protein